MNLLHAIAMVYPTHLKCNFTCPVWKHHALWSNREMCRNLCTVDTLENSPMFVHTFASIVCGTRRLCCSTAMQSNESYCMVPFHRSRWCTNQFVCVHSLGVWHWYAHYKTNEMFWKIRIGSHVLLHTANGMNAGTLLHSIQWWRSVLGNNDRTEK